ncbi:MAG TPA: EFR1 family ferrodoxin [Candidatus Gracilibacteria bacterium]|nr:EFR1 family ferrodoxin [Candidatus Gracilibacteria bacterium]
MAKYLLAYFTGTGNTQKVTELLAEDLRSQGEVELFPMEKLTRDQVRPELESYDKIGILYPIHAFNAPRIVFDFIEQIGDFKQKKTFILKSPGSDFWQGGSIKIMRDFLLKHQAQVFYENLVVAPPNYLWKKSAAEEQKIWQRATLKIHSIAQDLDYQKEKREKTSPLVHLISKIISKMETRGAQEFAQSLVVNAKCQKCGLCIKNCPQQNIYWEQDQIKFGKNCLMCLRCIKNCPVQAISKLGK